MPGVRPRTSLFQVTDAWLAVVAPPTPGTVVSDTAMSGARARTGRHWTWPRDEPRRAEVDVSADGLSQGQSLEHGRRHHSHSIVDGGFDVMSSTTRFTSGTSFTIREEIVSSRSYGSRAQSAVIASSLVTARTTTG
jgi:hypothetical protein